MINHVILLRTAATRLADSESIIANDSIEEELVYKGRATIVEWKWFGYKISDVQQTTKICKKCKITVTVMKRAIGQNNFSASSRSMWLSMWNDNNLTRREMPELSWYDIRTHLYPSYHCLEALQ